MAKTHELSGTTSPNKASTVIASKPAHKLALGIVLITSAFLCAAIMSALSKKAAGIPALLILFLQYAISFIIFVPAALSQRIVRLKTGHLALQIFRSVAGSVCQLLFFIAVRSIPLLVAVLLSNAAPLFIPIVVYIWFRKAVQPLVWISLLIGLFGIVLIIRPGPAMFHTPAALIALAAGLFSALALVATNRLAETEPPTRILVYNFGDIDLALDPVMYSVLETTGGEAVAPLNRHRKFLRSDAIPDHSGLSARKRDRALAVQLHGSDLLGFARLVAIRFCSRTQQHWGHDSDLCRRHPQHRVGTH